MWAVVHIYTLQISYVVQVGTPRYIHVFKFIAPQTYIFSLILLFNIGLWKAFLIRSVILWFNN